MLMSVNEYNNIIQHISNVWLYDLSISDKRELSNELFSKIKYSPYFIWYSFKPTYFELVSKNKNKSRSFILVSSCLYWKSKEGMMWLRDVNYPIPTDMLGRYLSRNDLSKDDVDFLKWLVNDFKMKYDTTTTINYIWEMVNHYNNENYYDAVRILVKNPLLTNKDIDKKYFTDNRYYECL